MKVGFDGSDLLGESGEQGQRVLALDGKSTAERESCETLLVGDGDRQDHARLAVFVRASHSSRLGAKARSRLAFAFEAPRN